MDEDDEMRTIASEFDTLSCSQQVDLVVGMLSDAVEQKRVDLVEAALIPLALIRNRVARLEGND